MKLMIFEIKFSKKRGESEKVDFEIFLICEEADLKLIQKNISFIFKKNKKRDLLINIIISDIHRNLKKSPESIQNSGEI